MSVSYLVNGEPVSSVLCGETITFDVTGYPRAWIIVAQDGQVTFDAPMDLPMPAYKLKCSDDIGYFQAAAYAITPQGGRGNVIGTASLNVRPASAQPSTPTLTPTTPSEPGITPGGSGGTVEIHDTGGPPIEFTQGDVAAQGVDFTTVGLIALGALIVLPALFKKGKGGA